MALTGASRTLTIVPIDRVDDCTEEMQRLVHKAGTTIAKLLTTAIKIGVKLQYVMISSGNHVIACALFFIKNEEKDDYFLGLDVVSVEKQYRRKGYGGTLITFLKHHLIECMKRDDVQTGYMCLNVEHDNTAAISCYRKHGFRHYGSSGRYIMMTCDMTTRTQLPEVVIPSFSEDATTEHCPMVPQSNSSISQNTGEVPSFMREIGVVLHIDNAKPVTCKCGKPIHQMDVSRGITMCVWGCSVGPKCTKCSKPLFSSSVAKGITKCEYGCF